MAQSNIVRVLACLAINFVIVHAKKTDEHFEKFKQQHRKYVLRDIVLERMDHFKIVSIEATACIDSRQFS